MAIRNKRMALVCAGLATCNVLVAVAAQPQDVSFEEAQNFGAGNGPLSVAVGDFNRDGVQDLAVAYRGSVRPFVPGGVSVLLGNGDGSFQAALNFAVGSLSTSVAVGEFNGDKVLDLAVANADSNDVLVLLGNGDGSFLAAQIFGAGNGTVSVGVGDFNGDGLPDLAVPNNRSDNVSVLINNTPQ